MLILITVRVEGTSGEVHVRASRDPILEGKYPDS